MTAQPSSSSSTSSSALPGYTLSQPNDSRSYTDFVLYSPSPGTREWRHNLLKLVPASKKDAVDLRSFKKPVKLNRRDERSLRAENEPKGDETDDPSSAANGGKQEDPNKAGRDESLIAPGASRRWGAQLQPQNQPKGGAGGGGASGGGGAAMPMPRKSKPFEKRTSRVFQTEASVASRKLAKQEQCPWLLEDASGSERWIGHLTGGAAGLGGIQDGATGGTSATKAGSQMLFVIDEAGQSGGMRVLGADRTYRFAPKQTSRNVNSEEAELEFEKRSKSKVEDRWGYRTKKAQQAVKGDPDAAPAPSFRAVHGPKKTTASGRVKREDADEFDEVEFEEEMQDDEEGQGGFADDAMEEEEAKMLEERIKRSQRGGNHLTGDVDTTQAEDESAVFGQRDEALDKAGKKARKLLKKHRKEGGQQDDEDDDSDDEGKGKNPYAPESEEEDEDEEDIAVPQAQQQQQQHKPKPRPLQLPGQQSSRAPSPASASGRSGSAAPSPVPQSNSRASSPQASGLKRKGDELDAPDRSKSHKKEVDGDTQAARAVLTEDVVIKFVKSASSPQEATTKNLLKFVKNKLGVNPRNPGVSDLLQTMIKTTCTLVDGVLVLKAGF